MYFKEFPKMYYTFLDENGDEKIRLVTDITRNVRFRKEILESVTLYDEYDIQDGETPEIIAEKVYGNPEYHWIIMLANQKYNWLYDFPKEETVMLRDLKREFNPTITATSWSYSGTTITVTKKNHGLKTTPVITLTVTGAESTTNAPNGTFTAGVSSVTDDTFTFEVDTAPTGTAGGTMVIDTDGREKYPAHWISDEFPGHEGHGHWFKCDSDFPGAVAVTCEQMYRDENEKKRRIKLISKSSIATILKNFRDQM